MDIFNAAVNCYNTLRDDHGDDQALVIASTLFDIPKDELWEIVVILNTIIHAE